MRMKGSFLAELAARRRFGMKPGLETMTALCRALGDPQRRFRAIHVAGTNGKGAVCAILDAALGAAEAGPVGRYTSPHLVRLNERFFLDGAPVGDATLERLSRTVHETVGCLLPAAELTFFEALTAVAFLLFAERRVSHAVLECGLGGRLDATNVCAPELCVITKVGLDHCDWLGNTVEKIAAEKAGIVKPGVPVVLARNEPSVVAVVRAVAQAKGAPFHYAPDLADAAEIPADFALPGAFNRENAVTALAALKVLDARPSVPPSAFARVVWPGRFQRVGAFLVDGAHNPPAARALAASLAELPDVGGARRLNLVFGACGDKAVADVLRILAPFVARAYAVRTGNPRSLSAEDLATTMRAVGLAATPCASLAEALARASADVAPGTGPAVLVGGSLFLAGEALVALDAYPWPATRFDPSELLGRVDTSKAEVQNRISLKAEQEKQS